MFSIDAKATGRKALARSDRPPIIGEVGSRRIWIRATQFTRAGTQTGGQKHEHFRSQCPRRNRQGSQEGTPTSHVLIDVKGLTVTSSITNESVGELGLKTGLKVKAVIKSSDVMVAVE
jgi:molybdopterin-binding protein